MGPYSLKRRTKVVRAAQSFKLCAALTICVRLFKHYGLILSPCNLCSELMPGSRTGRIQEQKASRDVAGATCVWKCRGAGITNGVFKLELVKAGVRRRGEAGTALNEDEKFRDIRNYVEQLKVDFHMASTFFYCREEVSPEGCGMSARQLRKSKG